MAIKPGSVLLKRLGYALKLILSVVITWLVFRKINLSDVLEGIAAIPPALAALILVISLLRHYLQYQNWWLALQMNPGFIAKRRDIQCSYLIGNFLRFLLPGGHGTFGKVFFIKNSSKTATAVAVTSERAAQTWAVFLFAALGASYYYLDWAVELRILLLGFIAIFPLLLWIPVRYHPAFSEVREGYRRDLPWMLLIQICTNLLTMLQYWLLLSLMLKISFPQTVLRMSLVQFSDTIPITISGLGLREGFAVHFLEDAGVTAKQAVTATLGLFIFQDLIPGLVGLPFFLTHKKSSAKEG
ncbi:MAG TPA: lysylphosphatidylglycerol synthase transmembrane domain-containing protein [Candidatus Cloacimonadota bacterium]|nr:lysylphosphatidylglycerol synthase transmembrane domain-containing protein [Candidatus Cloacimonadota bacterium]